VSAGVQHFTQHTTSSSLRSLTKCGAILPKFKSVHSQLLRALALAPHVSLFASARADVACRSCQSLCGCLGPSSSTGSSGTAGWHQQAGAYFRARASMDHSLTATRAAPHHLPPSHTQCNLHVRRRHSGRCQPVQGPRYLWHRFLVQVFQGGSVLPCVSLRCVAVAVAVA